MRITRPSFYCGVIEGFYGRPWSWDQRMRMLDTLADNGLNAYLYAPKFDLNHRFDWRRPYSKQAIRHLIRFCRKGRESDISVILSLSPGLSFTGKDMDILKARFEDLAGVEPSGLALLMDDIPYDQANPLEHADIASELIHHVHSDFAWFFCPTAYSGWHLKTWNHAERYLDILGQALPDDYNLFWTGRTVVSRAIHADDILPVQGILHRKPLIWDNFPANDYVPANSFFPGPLTDRSSDLLTCCAGLMVNPSEIFSGSVMSVCTLGEWFRDTTSYNPAKAFQNALRHLASDSGSQQILQIVFGYFYTPFAISETWQILLKRVQDVCRNTAEAETVISDLETIRAQLKDESNIKRMTEIWFEIYPFVRTLLGDLDYLVDLCRRIRNEESSSFLPPLRDPRWSTPVNDLILSLRMR